MAFGTFTKTSSENFVGGPRVVTGTISAESGDLNTSIDLSEYFANGMIHAQASVEGAEIDPTAAVNVEVGVKAIDITTDPKLLDLTIANPLATVSIKIVAIGT